MTTTNDDGRYDDVLREAASRDYHAPPAATPRDEMWERIAAARRAARRAADGDAARVPEDVVPPAPDVVVLPTRTRWRSAAWARRALAAAALLAVGIGVGRWSATTRGTTAPSAATSVASTGPTPPRTTTPESLRAGDAAASATREPTTLASVNAETTRGGLSGAPPSPARRAEGRGPSAEGREPPAERLALPYRLAAAEHLALTEALLTTVSADARAGRAADSSVALWARDLLGTTRMLLDSPAARDPKLARLLQDLELVLAEVAQLRPARGAEELQSIDRAVRQRGVLTRLRSTVPAAPLSAGT